MKTMMSRILLLFIITLALYGINGIPLNNEDGLLLVHVVFRHGHRTSYRFYPTDPYLNHTFHPHGRAGLTNKGKLTAHRLGELLRAEYGKFLGDYYTPEILYVQTTDTIRTRFTAQLVATGLWPPVGEQQWHPEITWQPVVIYTKPSEEEDLLEFYNCEYRNKLVAELPKNKTAYETFLLPNKDLIDFVEQQSGLHIKDMRDLLSFYHTLKTESEVGLKLPEWTTKVYPEPLKTVTTKTYQYLTFDSRLKSFHAGFLIRKWLEDSRAKMTNTLTPAERKMFLYSGHESTVGYVLTVLNVTEPHVPDYGSALIAELHQKSGKPFFKLRYIKSPLTGSITDLTIPGCGVLCPLEQFADLYGHLLPKGSFTEVCRLNNSTSA